MANETTKDLLNRIELKVDKIDEDVAFIKLDFALKLSQLENSNDKRFTKVERYLKSDPDTKQVGAIEKLDKVDRRVSALETKATAFGFAGGIIFVGLKWLISIFV